jgi:glycosyltransferase involved in cell wall biosynthesis
VIRPIKVNEKLPFKALQFWLYLPHEIRKAELKNKFDIIHINDISYGFLKRRLSLAPHVVTVHHLAKDAIKVNNSNPLYKVRNMGSESSNIIPFFQKRGIMYADKLIAVSNYTKKQIVDTYNIDTSLVSVIYNGIDSLDYNITVEEIEQTRELLGVKKRPMILFVGRVDDPRKNIRILLYSIANILKKIDVVLVIVGKGDPIEAKAICESLGISNNVVFTGFVDNNYLKRCYFSCDIYVCPSKLEGFGLTLLEAMVAGKPIVATNVGAIPEIIEDGINGILVKSDDIDDLCAAMFKILENRMEEAKMCKTNIEKITNFSWDICAQKILEIYKESSHKL